MAKGKHSMKDVKVEMVAPPVPVEQEPPSPGVGPNVNLAQLNQIDIQRKTFEPSQSELQKTIADPELPGVTLSNGTVRTRGTQEVKTNNNVKSIYEIGNAPRSVQKGTIGNSRTTRTSY